MNITEVKIFLVDGDEKLKAFVSVTLDDAIAIKDMKLIQADHRLFLAMPSRRTKAMTYKDIVHPVNPRAREKLEAAVLKAYVEALHQPAQAHL